MLYGGREFASLAFIALVLRLIFNLIFGGIFDNLDVLTSVGIVTAELIASTISKQGLKLTLFGTEIVTTIVYASVELIAAI